jgi:pimeloyl-ACP methyl ester carboxylesterase
MRKAGTVLAGLSLLVLASCGDRASPSGPSTLILEAYFDQTLHETLYHGVLTVPEDEANPGGRTIGINIVKLPARGASAVPDPVFFFCGGPGVGGTVNVPRWAGMFARLRAHRDVILIDQRGTGSSNPLPCRRPGDPDSAQTYLGDMYPVDYVTNCRRELETHADLRFYTTSHAVDDVEKVRAALGYDLINVVGGSYGSRSGYVYMMRYHQHVRTALLWSINPPEMKFPSTLAQDTEDAMRRLFADCTADPDCHMDYPALEDDFDRVLAVMRAGPLVSSITNPFTGEPETVTFTYNDFITGIRSLLYANADASYIPYFIYSAARWDFAWLIEYTVSYLRSINEVYMDGLYLCVQCAEHNPYIDFDEARAMAVGTFMGTYRLDQQDLACSLWVRGSLPAGFFDLPPLDVPTLVISGELDPVCPPRFGQVLADSLPGSLHAIIPHHAHGVGDVWENCLDDAVVAFIDQGSLAGLDLSCIQQNVRPPFISWRDIPSRSTEGRDATANARFSPEH